MKADWALQTILSIRSYGKFLLNDKLQCERRCLFRATTVDNDA